MKQRILGYLVEQHTRSGRSGSKILSHSGIFPKGGCLLFGAKRATVFTSRAAANIAIKRTVKYRSRVSGDTYADPKSFHVVKLLVPSSPAASGKGGANG